MKFVVTTLQGNKGRMKYLLDSYKSVTLGTVVFFYFVDRFIGWHQNDYQQRSCFQLGLS